MSLSLPQLQRIVTEVAAELEPGLDVSVARTEGDSEYAEVLLTLTGCSPEPYQTMINFNRAQPEAAVRAVIAEGLKTQLSTLKAQQV